MGSAAAPRRPVLLVLATPNSKHFSSLKLNVLIISNTGSCGRSSTNVRGVMILCTFVEERHWRGGLIVEHVPEMSSHHNDSLDSDGKNDTFFRCFLTMSLNHHLETDKCGVYSTHEELCKIVTFCTKTFALFLEPSSCCIAGVKAPHKPLPNTSPALTAA